MQMWSRVSLRFFRGRLFVVSLLTGLSVWCLLSMRSYYTQDPSAQIKLNAKLIVKQACQHPDLEIYNPLILKHLKDLGSLKCSPDPDWLFLSNGSLYINPKAVESHGNFICSVNFLKRINDYSSEDLKTVTLASSTKKMNLDSDFFNVECKVKNRKFWDRSKVWDNIMAGIHRDKAAVNRAKDIIKTASNNTKWNVLMFGLDSMSRMHYMRKLPKTYDFLKNDLKAVVLEGYNIVGDGTPQALIPILTGYTEPELPDTRRRIPNSHFVNVYPFVWKNFTREGYVTAFAEDTPSTGIFTYRLNGFKEQPTDHYMRTFYVEAANKLGYHPHYCLGSIPRHKVMLDWLRQFYDVYPEVPKFCFGFHGELSHDDFNLVQHVDQDLFQFLNDLKKDGILDNTFLILMSDHGHRFTSIRSTVQGKQEERLPFFSIVPPIAFREQHSELWHNLETNAKRLSTPFDIYSTLLSLLDTNIPLVGDVNRRSISLFSEIPYDRSCTHADIEPHWCTCLSWEEVSTESPIVKEAAEAVVDFINEFITPYQNQCSRLTLDKVTRAERHMPNSALLKYKNAKDQDGQVADLSDSVEATEVLYQVQLSVFPSEGVYEASVKFRRASNTFHLRETEISRVNLYGTQPHCVQEKLPQLRKYCYCKIQLT